MVCASLSLLLCAVETILIRQLVVDLTPGHLKSNVLNFPGDVMAGEAMAEFLEPVIRALVEQRD